ncbi:MAG: type II 3-dehydroquinate dehydratase [Rhodospirillales bacterium]
MRLRILILNGPNLNLLGEREPHIYGAATLADVESACRQRARALGAEMEFRQSNAESDLIDWVQSARKTADALIINAGAYSHTSIALLDALLALAIPVIEVHISNIFCREPFRHHSYVSRAARGVICGLGTFGYELAIEAAVDALKPTVAAG